MSDIAKSYRPLPSNFVVYDHDNPSPLFSPEWVAYIESINPDFSDEDLATIRAIERFALNMNTNSIGTDGIPGLRTRPGRDHIYLQRTSKDPWRKWIQAFFAHVPEGFEGRTYSRMNLCRFILPNGDRYYPITFFGDLDRWRAELPRAAQLCGTLLAKFRAGKFEISDGQVIPFGSMKYEYLPRQKGIPRNW